ncbi:MULTISPECIES: NADPH-dependent FMN reductase [Cyanophyceae]|uniref:NAD(P)H-dependent oxidoreductase n=1 Tax=Leptolyngbya subtilissima DQ-A4 TaxID=2933933 RepID=A0ABV0K8N9_9CYAN|nr:NADPH-dependent FMN reductase [Nodosilinea sp. FACHB-141]MBD2110274.1 NAD(P)H-dependent oxidoreductase [Nodosilinea sp. FACHB-141]
MTSTDAVNTARIVHILAISGSLRQGSSNMALLKAAIALSPKFVEMNLYGGLDDLPHFNPDLEPAEPLAVTDLRAQVKWADGIIISSPEYAHGVPGVLKNALDWLVSGEEFMGKPVAIFNASPRATYAQASLIEIVTTMAGRIVPEACITVSLLGKNLDVAGILAEPEIAGELSAAIMALINEIEPSTAVHL